MPQPSIIQMAFQVLALLGVSELLLVTSLSGTGILLANGPKDPEYCWEEIHFTKNDSYINEV